MFEFLSSITLSALNSLCHIFDFDTNDWQDFM